MNPNHKHKTIAYIILGIVVVIALGVYIYIVLSNAPVVNAPAPTQNVAVVPQQVTLTPSEAAAKIAAIAELGGKQESLTKQQANVKAALLKQQLSQSK